ncbi:MAG TPA: NAD(P) transhydrogenase subunit alpha [Caulobacteraceae bacterium]|jgi:NAD(P) transhydrogenase subunit alpha|nr:NAD(P) transhydrogenase subunit alpha [Caulobacteraceae bacterium]
MLQAADRTGLAVLAEQAAGERRVALVPRDVEKLAARAAMFVEHGAGLEAGFPDEAYRDAGATLLARGAVLEAADVALAIRPPADLEGLRQGATLISLGAHDADLVAALRNRAVSHLALERLPRITRAQSMDVLSSQATIAGYAAVIEGARMLDTLLPMLTTAAGIIRPARMIALGAGVAGLQAIATARRLGAVAHGFDVRAAAREQVESFGAEFVFPEVDVPFADGAGGYAGSQSAEQQKALRRALTPILADMQLVVSSAQIPGRPAPLLIDDETLAAMARGTVIVDLAAESGGNTSRTRANETVAVGGVMILGSTNFASLMPADASRLFSSNVRSLVDHLLGADGRLQLSLDDEITTALLGAPAIVQAA